MTDSRPSQDNQISYAQEMARKATHLGALIVPFGYYFFDFDRAGMLYILVPVTVLMFLIDLARLHDRGLWRRLVSRFFGQMIREHEHAGNFTGATYILLSMCLTIGLYDRPIAVAALAFIIVGDTLAAMIGRKFGRHRFKGKSVEGSLGCLAGTVIVAFVVASFEPSFLLQVGLIGAVVATVTEAVSFSIDDNISVPLVSGLAMTLLTKVF